MADKARLPLKNDPRSLLRKILMLEDTAHSIALGTAIGMFIGLTPTVGIQMIMVMITAFLTRPFFHFNRVAALITVYVSNPLTMLLIYWFDYKVGTLFVPATVAYEEFAAIFEYNGLQGWWETIVALFVKIGAPLLVGSLLVGAVGGIVTYPTMRWLVHVFRHPRDTSSEGREKEQSGGVRSDENRQNYSVAEAPSTGPFASTRG